MPPILHEVKQALGDAITVIKVDVDKYNYFALQYGIQFMPTLMIFQNDEVKWRHAGIVPVPTPEAQLQPYL